MVQEAWLAGRQVVVPLFLVTALCAIAFLFARWVREVRDHHRRIEGLEWRIHVNGIRGKSTVARNVAGMLREAGFTTIAKSTGTQAAVINRDGIDEPIIRKGPPTILEQIEVTKRYVTADVDALVIECMALKPEYQDVSERMIVRSNVGILTNVREDHQDVMGETLPEIARSLLSTCPFDGLLITAEQDPELQAIIREVAPLSLEDRRSSRDEPLASHSRGNPHVVPPAAPHARLERAMGAAGTGTAPASRARASRRRWRRRARHPKRDERLTNMACAKCALRHCVQRVDSLC